MRSYLDRVAAIAAGLDRVAIEEMVVALVDLRERGGWVFFLGVGGSVGNCDHAVNDFRKLCGIEAYAPTDNIPELTARTNDDGWETVFGEWLITSQARQGDGALVFSIGGGSLERVVSVNIVRALELAVERKLSNLRHRRARRWPH